MTETKQLGLSLPIIFHNAFVDHEIDGSHRFHDAGADPTQEGELQRDDDRLKFHDGTIVQILAWLKDFTGFVSGLELSYLTPSAVRIEPGICLDDTALIIDASPEVIKSKLSINVDITVSGVNGLDTGSEAASTWYYVWLIRSSLLGTVAGLLSLRPTSPTMPANYDKKRRIGCVRNDAGSDFLEFIQFGTGEVRAYQYREAVDSTLRVLSGGTANTWTDVDCSSLVPETSVWPYLSVQNESPAVGTAGEIRTKGLLVVQRRITTSDGRIFYMETDASRYIQYQRLSAGSINISVLGFREKI